MKTTIATLLIAAMICSINYSASAQTRIGGNIGLAIPNGDNADGSGSGIGINGRILFPLSDNFFLGGNVGYHSAAEISFVPITAACEYVFNEEEALQPYLGIDLGIYNVSYTEEVEYPAYYGNWYDVETKTYEVSKTKFGWALHGGLYLQLNDNLDFNADVKFNTISASEKYVFRYIDVSVGLFFKLSSSSSYKK